MEVCARSLLKVAPAVADMVRESSRDIRNHAMLLPTEEQEHLFFIAKTMESSLESANKALETHAVINALMSQYEKTMDPSMLKQLQMVQTNQQAIVKCNVKTLTDSGRHYQQEYMPGSNQGLFATNSIDTPEANSKALPFSCDASESREIANSSVGSENETTNRKSALKIQNSGSKKRGSQVAMKSLVNNSTHYLGLTPQFGMSPSTRVDSGTKTNLSLHFLSSWSTTNLNSRCAAIKGKGPIFECGRHYNHEQDASPSSLNRLAWLKNVVVLTHFLAAVAIALKNDQSTNNTSEVTSSHDNTNVIHNQDKPSM